MVSLKLTRPISCILKKVNGALLNENHENERGGKSKHRGISQEQVCIQVARVRTKATVSKIACMGRIVKSKVDTLIGSKLSQRDREEQI